jgi:hypothetical protein
MVRVVDAAASAITAVAVERALAEAPKAGRDLLLVELLEALVQQDAPAAARIAEREVDGYQRETALRVVVQIWAQRNFAEAIAWADSLVDPRERDTALANTALELVRGQPQLALQVLGRRSTTTVPDTALEGVVQQWATEDFAAAYLWVEAQPAGPGRDALVERLVFVRAEQDPAEAARIAETTFSGEARRMNAISTLAHRWAAMDPAAVHAWSLTLDERAQRRVRTETELVE